MKKKQYLQTLKNLSIQMETNMAAFRNLTAQAKTVAVARSMGLNNVQNQQGTSRMLYDTLPLDGTNNFQFFQNVQSRQYPFTNLNQNKLQEGETMTIQRMYFSVVTFDDVTGQPVDLLTFEEATLPEFYLSDWSVFFDTIQTIKDTSLSSQCSKFNKFASYANNEVVTMDNNIVLPTNIQWRVALRTPTYTPVADSYIRCTCLLYTSPSPRDRTRSRMPSSA